MQTLEETVLKPIMWAVAWLMVGFHKAFTYIGIPADNGWSWALSIVGLTVVIRIILIPLFVKQIHASRRMQLIQPEMQKIQKKYKGKNDPESRQAMTQETMDLYKRTGTNPFSSCLPILLQSPIFFALYRVLYDLSQVASGQHAPIGGLTQGLAAIAERSTIFGASLSSTFTNTHDMNVRVLTVVMIIMMAVSMFTSQYQLMRKNMPASALDNPMAKQQKWLIYLMPLFFLFVGPNFPIGVLIYWVTTNVWSMGQQFYVIRNMPAPGSAAEKALEQRRARKGKAHTKFSIPGLHSGDSDVVEGEVLEEGAADGALPGGKVSGQRQQPKRKDRQRKPTPAGEPAAGDASAGDAAGDGSSGELAEEPPSSNGNGPQSGAGGSGRSGGSGQASGATAASAAGSGARSTARSPKRPVRASEANASGAPATGGSGKAAASAKDSGATGNTSERPAGQRPQPKKKGKGKGKGARQGTSR